MSGKKEESIADAVTPVASCCPTARSWHVLHCGVRQAWYGSTPFEPQPQNLSPNISRDPL